ncbi:MAG: RNA polymerase sigma factor [Candidatus Aminicenantes bacterium]|nr:RNA polymerase sigma factor [Candidatus Aminicenantes bacterium]
MDIAVAARKTGIFTRRICPASFEEHSMTVHEKFYTQFIAPVESRMMRSIWRLVRHEQLAEDTLQDVLILIWRKRERIRRHPNPEALILKMCLDCGYDSLRKQERRRRLVKARQAKTEKFSVEKSAAHELERKELEAEVLGAIACLSRKQATAVLMRIVQRQEYDVIARAMECSETTARIHVSRGRKRLSERLAHLLKSSVEGGSL